MHMLNIEILFLYYIILFGKAASAFGKGLLLWLVQKQELVGISMKQLKSLLFCTLTGQYRREDLK